MREELCIIASYANDPTVNAGLKITANAYSKLIVRIDAHLATPQQDGREEKLTKPAMVGNTSFGIGVSARLVIDRAQREYEYQHTPEKEAERLARVRAFIDEVNGDRALGRKGEG